MAAAAYWPKAPTPRDCSCAGFLNGHRISPAATPFLPIRVRFALIGSSMARPASAAAMHRNAVDAVARAGLAHVKS